MGQGHACTDLDWTIPSPTNIQRPEMTEVYLTTLRSGEGKVQGGYIQVILSIALTSSCYSEAIVQI